MNSTILLSGIDDENNITTDVTETTNKKIEENWSL
jgi:hypothetical protein